MEINSFLRKYLSFYVVVFILLITLISIRIIFLDNLVNFDHDNSRELLRVYKLFRYGEIIYNGAYFSEVWGFMSPIYYYFQAPFFVMMDYHPISGALLALSLNVLTLASLIYILKKLENRGTVYIAIILYGFSFFITKQAGYGLNPSMLPIFTVWTYYSLQKFFVSQHSRSLIILSVCLSAMAIFHPSGFFVFPPVLFFFYKYRKNMPKVLRSDYIISAAIFVFVAFLPYLIQEKKFNWWTFKQFYKYMQRGDGSEISYIQNIQNYFYVLMKNISIILFNDVIKTGMIIGLLVLIYVLYKGIKSFIYKKETNIHAEFLVIYIVGFGTLIKFETTDFFEPWLHAVFIPYLLIFMSKEIEKLLNINIMTKYLFLLLALLYIYINTQQYIAYKPANSDLVKVREVVEFIRNDSDKQEFDLYGVNVQPYYYVLWYFESNVSVKNDIYYPWVKWKKKKDSKLVYQVINKKDYLKKESKIAEKSKKIQDDHNLSEIHKVFDRGNTIIYKIY